MLKKLKTVHKVLLSLVLVVTVFLIWWLSVCDPYPNRNEKLSSLESNEPESKEYAPLEADSEIAVSEMTPIHVNSLGRNTLDGSTKKRPLPTENKKLNDKKLNEEQQLTHAKTQLAERLTINTDEIQSESLQRVTWRSSATGCPKPGRNYMQVLVPGVLIKLEANGTTYRYHANTGGRPFFCPAAQAETPAPSQDGTLE